MNKISAVALQKHISGRHDFKEKVLKITYITHSINRIRVTWGLWQCWWHFQHACTLSSFSFAYFQI